LFQENAHGYFHSDAFIFGVMGWAFSTHANFRITNLTREFESLTRKVQILEGGQERQSESVE
jgi:hypothetical protein